jgi:hypothetical protein
MHAYTACYGNTRPRKSFLTTPDPHERFVPRSRHMPRFSCPSALQRNADAFQHVSPVPCRSYLSSALVTTSTPGSSDCLRSRRAHASCDLWFRFLPPRPPPPCFLSPPSFCPSAPASASPPPIVRAAVARRFDRSIWVRMVFARYETTRTSWMWLLLGLLEFNSGAVKIQRTNRVQCLAGRPWAPGSVRSSGTVRARMRASLPRRARC